MLLPSAKEKLSKQDIQDIISSANKNFEAMGLNTRVMEYKGQDAFDPI